MILELASPASLPLGVVQINDQPALLSLTVQHPPVHLEAQAKRGGQITGPRAHIAYKYAQQYLEHLSLPLDTEIEIELAIPVFMGLGSDTMLALSISQALAWSHRRIFNPFQLISVLGLAPSQAGEIGGYARGGLILTSIHPTPAEDRILRRAEISHPERDAWAFIFHLPFPPDDIPESLETDRLQTLVNAVEHLPSGSSDLVETLFQAVEEDDIVSFGRALMTLQNVNHSALEKTGGGITLSTEDQKILTLMKEAGAVAWGQSLGGLCLWGLIKGGDPSRALRKRLADHVGIYGGRVMATVADNRGATMLEKQGHLGIENPIRPRADY